VQWSLKYPRCASGLWHLSQKSNIGAIARDTDKPLDGLNCRKYQRERRAMTCRGLGRLVTIGYLKDNLFMFSGACRVYERWCGVVSGTRAMKSLRGNLESHK